ncbi:ABC transporter ATP-binding protein [Streptomyces sp. ISL-10]|uniref:ABC transporter ATP-binding protein n=1 Tax=Streptomyces sp. ISL-10 TaxID=2819172 RepID=UPI001BEAAF6B|nr:ABC transporter ATP-binding protein [Streptomyces sp. ISL-10]MBT2370169.1 ABC transporter ATP-binding protein [Streptomyces sp. ISL-10]
MTATMPQDPETRLAVEVHGLRVVTEAGQPIVDGVSFTVYPGEVLAVIGESGSGKTTTALALLGFAGPGTAIAAGTVRIAGEALLGRPEPQTRRLRSRLVSYVPQDPALALNPARRVGVQLYEIVRAHGRHADADGAVGRALERARLPTDQRFLRRFPHQLSGGQRQRVVIAQALLLDPAVVVLDEPTTGLDAVTRQEFLTHLDRLRAETGAAMVYVTHDVAAIAPLADRVAVLHSGRIVEQGPARTVLVRPAAVYTRHLLAAVPDPHRPTPRPDGPDPDTTGALLRIRGLAATHRSGAQQVVAAHGVDLDLPAGTCLALVGESGSGKTTIGRCVAGLHRPDTGTVTLDGKPLGPTARRRDRDQRQAIQIVSQSASESLNPRRTVGAELARVLRHFDTVGEADTARRVAELLDSVRLPQAMADRYPGQLSGGERQRAAIARALAAGPRVLICDEITSALDVSVQATVLDLLSDLRRRLDLTLLFITHDLGVVASIADHVALLHHGRIEVSGPTRDVLHDNPHPLARRLLDAAPSLSLSHHPGALAPPIGRTPHPHH